MTEKEALDLNDIKDRSDFEKWWDNEAHEHMIYFSEEAEKKVYDLSLTAWLNGAFKARN